LICPALRLWSSNTYPGIDKPGIWVTDLFRTLCTAPVDKMLPVMLMLAPVYAVPTLPIKPGATLPNVASSV
jgi:hypothetical protein